MSELKGKIDFTLFISANNANPNGDPLNGNRPRINMVVLEKFQMYVLKEKLEIVFRIWDRRFLFSQMTEQMMLIPV